MNQMISLARKESPSTPRVGEKLVQLKLITPDQLRIALHEQQKMVIC